MDIEFHYYMTYLIAVRAGFTPADATIVAQSAQEIDDNHLVMKVSQGTSYAYTSTLSQTMDILRPHHARRIYPIFHFIPGDPSAPTAKRKDDGTSPWVTTPNSALANEMLDTALRSGDLYRIGASAHAYADTWVHQNFLGKDDSYNVMPGGSLTDRAEATVSLMRIGHALAGHSPDIPALIWTDARLASENVDNTVRFLDAAGHLYRKLGAFKDPGVSRTQLDRTAASLVADLASDIGPSSRAATALDEGRIERYRQRALSPEYGASPIPGYREARWADAAFNEQRSDLSEQIAIYLARHGGLVGDILDFGTSIPCTWKDPANRTETDWYKFQEAVRSHLDECWDVLRLRLPDLVQ
jgi:hypothetical protein